MWLNSKKDLIHPNLESYSSIASGDSVEMLQAASWCFRWKDIEKHMEANNVETLGLCWDVLNGDLHDNNPKARDVVASVPWIHNVKCGAEHSVEMLCSRECWLGCVQALTKLWTSQIWLLWPWEMTKMLLNDLELSKMVWNNIINKIQSFSYRLTQR